MHFLTPQARSLAAAVFLFALLVAPASKAANDLMQRNATPPVLNWRDCGGGFECATADVPLDYDRPFGSKIELPLIRRQASDQKNKIGSLFFHQGGSGQNVAAVRAFPPFIFDLFPRFDFVAFDQRGVGGSRPAVKSCGPNPAYDLPMPTPTTVDNVRLVRSITKYGKRCERINRDLLPHLSSANVARDLDMLRQAVGDQKLTYLGVSFGTTVGATYASLFPGRARALLLDSAMDVDGYLRNPVANWRAYAESHEEVLRRFLSACAASPGTCGFGGKDPSAALDRLMAQLRLRPLPSEDPATPGSLTVAHVQAALGKALRRRILWPHLAFALEEARKGRPASLLRFSGPVEPGPTDDFLTGLYAVDQMYSRYAPSYYFRIAERSYADFPHFAFASGYPDLVHALWPVRDHDAYRGTIRNPVQAAPVLVIGMTHDPATPFQEAERLTKSLGNARLLKFEADGHFAVGTLDECVLAHALTYLEDVRLPPKGAVCVQQGSPFPSTIRELKESQAPPVDWSIVYWPRSR